MKMTATELRSRARKVEHVRYFDDFVVGQEFLHHWGRTITDADNALFCSLTLHYTPLYLNAPYAASLGHATPPVNPYLGFLMVFGMSVEDLSESGGAFLGVKDLRFHGSVRVGDTLVGRSTVLKLRESESWAGSGIATWHTQGLNQDGDVVIEFERTNMIAKRGDR